MDKVSPLVRSNVMFRWGLSRGRAEGLLWGVGLALAAVFLAACLYVWL